MTPLTRFLAFEVIDWAVVGALLAWLVEIEVVPLWLAAVVFTAWVAKDFALYPVTRKAYEHGPTHGSADLLGTDVPVETTLSPDGYVAAGNERWRAQPAPGCGEALQAGETARVCALEGITLIVEPRSAG